jgi:hypothetical protein
VGVYYKKDIKKYVGCGLNSSKAGQRPVAGCCEKVNELSDPI